MLVQTFFRPKALALLTLAYLAATPAFAAKPSPNQDSNETPSFLNAEKSEAESNQLMKNLEKAYPLFVHVKDNGSDLSLATPQVLAAMSDKIQKLQADNNDLRARLEQVEAAQKTPSKVTAVRP